jgi:hypothetical protein
MLSLVSEDPALPVTLLLGLEAVGVALRPAVEEGGALVLNPTLLNFLRPE